MRERESRGSSDDDLYGRWILGNTRVEVKNRGLDYTYTEYQDDAVSRSQS